jgi:hypothetical protein
LDRFTWTRHPFHEQDSESWLSHSMGVEIDPRGGRNRPRGPTGRPVTPFLGNGFSAGMTCSVPQSLISLRPRHHWTPIGGGTADYMAIALSRFLDPPGGGTPPLQRRLGGVPPPSSGGWGVLYRGSLAWAGDPLWGLLL